MIPKHLLPILIFFLALTSLEAQQEVQMTAPEFQSIVEKIRDLRGRYATEHQQQPVIDADRKALLYRYAVLEDKLRKLKTYYKVQNKLARVSQKGNVDNSLPIQNTLQPDKSGSKSGETTVNVNVEKDTIIIVQNDRTDTYKDSMYLVTLQKLMDKIERLQQPQAAQTTINFAKGRYKTEKRSLLYGNNQFALTENHKASLIAMANAIKANSELDILIEGFTSEKGSAAYNATLSQRRAETAKQYLVKQGIHPNRIFTEYHGIDYSVDADNARRVDVYLIENTIQRKP